MKFSANEAYKGLVPQGHWYSLYASGALAGMTECFFIAAPETVKVCSPEASFPPLPALQCPTGAHAEQGIHRHVPKHRGRRFEDNAAGGADGLHPRIRAVSLAARRLERNVSIC